MEPEKVSQDEPAGNTKTAGSKKSYYQAYRWFFTLKRDFKNFHGVIEPIEPENLAKILREFCKEFYFQLESGEQTGYVHYQGVVSLDKKHRMKEVVNLFGTKVVHVEPAKNWYSSIKYCAKDETKLKGPWDHNSVWVETITELNWWQSELKDTLLCKPDNRTIYWLWDSVGNIGKSSFCKYAAVHLGATVLGNGSFTDIAFAIGDNPKTIIFDLPRTIEGRVNYTAIEKCKDGMVFSGKYESRTKIFNPPHIVVFANFSPDMHAMSADRWVVICLDTEKNDDRGGRRAPHPTPLDLSLGI